MAKHKGPQRDRPPRLRFLIGNVTAANFRRRANACYPVFAPAASRGEAYLRRVRAASQLRWGVVQPVGHLTVNEDGEGSNPSAPANPPETARFIFQFLTKYSFSNN